LFGCPLQNWQASTPLPPLPPTLQTLYAPFIDLHAAALPRSLLVRRAM
jgi:hypothetical protein